HLLRYPLRLITNVYTSSALVFDEYVFATYFAMMFQGVEDRGAVFEEIFNSVTPRFIGDYLKAEEKRGAHGEQQERLLKMVEQLRAQFGDVITASYVNDFMIASSF